MLNHKTEWSADGGINWYLITANEPVGVHSFLIPNLPTGTHQMLLRITPIGEGLSVVSSEFSVTIGSSTDLLGTVISYSTVLGAINRPIILDGISEGSGVSASVITTLIKLNSSALSTGNSTGDITSLIKFAGDISVTAILSSTLTVGLIQALACMTYGVTTVGGSITGLIKFNGLINSSASLVATLTVVGDTTAPTVTAFTIADLTPESLTATISAFTATDAVGVTGYLITESSTPPATGAAGWVGTAPTSYTRGSAGTVPLYGWAKDAAGNVSAGVNGGSVVFVVAGAVVTDDFNRANGGMGANWTALSSPYTSPAISSTKVIGGVGSFGSRYNSEFSDNQYAMVDSGTLVIGSALGPIIRSSPSDNTKYQAVAYFDGVTCGVYLQKAVLNVSTTLGSFPLDFTVFGVCVDGEGGTEKNVY